MNNYFPRVSLSIIAIIMLNSCLPPSAVEETVFISPKDEGIQDSCNSSFAISMEEAKNSFFDILNEINKKVLRNNNQNQIDIVSSYVITPHSQYTLRYSKKDVEEINPYYIFNLSNNGGFAIMSGDSRCEPLIAWTSEGNYLPSKVDEDPLLKRIVSMVDEYYILKTKERGHIPGAEDPNNTIGKLVVDKWTKSNMINGACPVKWNQWPPFNKYIPLNDGAVGCVPIAVGQLMACYSYPLSIEGRYLNWQSIRESSPSEIDNIAWLLRCLGYKKNLNVTYGSLYSGGSGAPSENIPRTLKNYGYSNGGKYQAYNEEKIIKELNNGYYVLAGGLKLDSKNTKVGHQWLIHGLLEHFKSYEVLGYHPRNGWIVVGAHDEVSDYLLVNWGWKEYFSYDGYYLSGLFNPNKGPAYPETQRAICNGDGKSKDQYFDLDMVIGIRK